MSNYDFDQITDRRNTGSLKWDVAEGELPMWVADMDFQTAPAVREAIEKRAAHGVFGYTDVEEDWYQAYMGWWERRHQFSIKKEWLTFCTGVVPAISSTVRKLTTPGENVLIQTPVYNIFFNSIVNNGRNVVECPLAYDGEKYEMDFEALEEKLSDPQTSLMILCNPHNPVGRIWERETLARVGELCEKYHVTVLSDEIHCDITRPGTGYLPFASVSETCKNISVTCIAPTKAFNIAGIQTAAVMIPNKALHHKVWRALNTDEVAEPNVFAIGAAIAAFTKGEDWLEELRAYLFENRAYMTDYIRKEIPQLKVVEADATYLLWVNCSALGCSAKELADEIRKTTGLYVSEGAQYGKTGEQFLRINLACQRSRIKDGCERLKRGVEAYRNQK